MVGFEKLSLITVSLDICKEDRELPQGCISQIPAERTMSRNAVDIGLKSIFQDIVGGLFGNVPWHHRNKIRGWFICTGKAKASMI